MTGDPAALRALLAEVTASAFGTDVPPGHPDAVTTRLLRPDFTRWQAHAARARGCARPVRLRGTSTTINAQTGEVTETFDTDQLPDATLYKPCGTRRESVCPACAETYRWDAYHLIAAGLRGGKGVPDTVTAHPGPSSPSPRRRSASSTLDRTAPADPEPDASGSVLAGPGVTGRIAGTGGRRLAVSSTETAIPGSVRRCASTATTTPHRSPGTPSSPSSGPAPSTPSNVSCAGSPAPTAAPRPASATPRLRSSKPAVPSTSMPWSASTGATLTTLTPSSLRRAGRRPSC